MSPAWRSQVLSVPSDDQVASTQAVTVPFPGWYGLCLQVSEGGSSCTCTFEATSNNNEALLQLPSGNEVVSSLQIGTIIFLEQDTNVTLHRTSLCSNHASDEAFEWCIQLQRMTDTRQHKRAPKKSLMCTRCSRLFDTLRSVQLHVDAVHRAVDPFWSQPLKVLYEDKYLAVVDKPQGMAVLNSNPSLARSDLLMALKGSDGDSLSKPIPVHRLDAPTGGLLVIAKTKTCESKLKLAFANRSCRKRYLALVFGKVKSSEGVINVPVDGKTAITRYRVRHYTRSCDEMAQGGYVTTVDLYPETGRRHQLRRHLKHIGHSIWGDRRYARYPKSKDKAVHSTTVQQDPHARLCLWATEITFPHPETGQEVTVALDGEPEWLETLVAYQEQLALQNNN